MAWFLLQGILQLRFPEGGLLDETLPPLRRLVLLALAP